MTIPVIDLEPFRSGSPAGRRHVAAAVDRAGREIGFLSIIGHGVTDELCADAMGAAAEFFALPLADRMSVVMPAPGYPYGYSPLSAESLERSLGGHAPPDLKETFNIGPVDPPAVPLDQMTDPDERAVYAPNLWPDAHLANFRTVMETYHRALARLSAQLMEVFAVALGLPPDWFDPFIDRHGSALRLAHYPPLDRPPLPDQLRAGAHTDYGTLTVLLTDGRPGLQVCSASGEWFEVGHVSGGFVVNIGDLMARWTNDRWRSTMHRVVVHETDRAHGRISIPFFHNANWDARIECIADDEVPARYRPVSAGRHLMSKFRSTVAEPPLA